MNEEKLRSFIKKIITEGESDEDKKPKRTSKKKKKADTQPGEIGATMGRGRWSKEVAEAGALAEEAPDELMDNLGIDSKSSGFKGVGAIINQALDGADVMKKSYGGMQSVSQGDKTGYMISMGELDSRNGAKYLHHTLIGAQNAGMLSLDVPLQIDRLDTSTVVVYQSGYKNSWSPKKKSSDK